LAILVILVLGALWAAVLLPPILRSRNGSGAPSGGIGDFVERLKSGLGSGLGAGRGRDAGLPALTPIMGPIGGPMNGPIGGQPMGVPGYGQQAPGTPMGPVRVPGTMSETQRRRRDVLLGLVGGVALTGLMALFAGSMMFWVLNLLADALLGGYVYLLLQLKAKRAHASGERQPAPAPRQTIEPQPMPVPHNVSQLRPRPATSSVTASRVDAPGEATVLALRRTASW
jgi:hypothetical protein